jgi:hypothetical protein
MSNYSECCTRDVILKQILKYSEDYANTVARMLDIADVCGPEYREAAEWAEVCREQMKDLRKELVSHCKEHGCVSSANPNIVAPAKHTKP